MLKRNLWDLAAMLPLVRFALAILIHPLARVHALPVTTDPTSITNQTFDYIIVGGGTAGLTVRCSNLAL